MSHVIALSNGRSMPKHCYSLYSLLNGIDMDLFVFLCVCVARVKGVK